MFDLKLLLYRLTCYCIIRYAGGKKEKKKKCLNISKTPKRKVENVEKILKELFQLFYSCAVHIIHYDFCYYEGT